MKFLTFLIKDFKGFTEIIEWIIRINTDIPWLKFVLIALIVFFLLSKVGEFFEEQNREKRIGKDKRREVSKEITKQNIVEKENSINISNLTFLAINFKFFKFKNANSKNEKPNFKPLILSFLSDINMYKGTFIKPEKEEDKQYYFLKFTSQSDALNFIKIFEKNIEDFSPILQDLGYEISYKIALDNRNSSISISEITGCLEKVLSVAQEFGIYTTSLFKEFYDKNTEDKIYLSFEPKGKYMINSETIELYYLEK